MGAMTYFEYRYKVNSMKRVIRDRSILQSEDMLWFAYDGMKALSTFWRIFPHRATNSVRFVDG